MHIADANGRCLRVGIVEIPIAVVAIRFDLDGARCRPIDTGGGKYFTRRGVLCAVVASVSVRVPIVQHVFAFVAVGSVGSRNCDSGLGRKTVGASCVRFDPTPCSGGGGP